MKNYTGVVLMLVLAACSNAQSPKESDHSKTVETATASVGVELENPKLQSIYNDYVILKDALVGSNYEPAKAAAASLEKQLAGYEGCENTSLIAKKISASKDLAAQRKEFTYLSSDVIALFNHATIKKGTIYVEHCPMANKGDGGSWLSSEKKIQNPYYGEEMMECGSVTDEFKVSI
jgi:hypothetical protein